MARNFTIIEEKDGINPLEFNQRLQQLSAAMTDILDGSQSQTTPTISSFTNAAHDHSDGANGGQLTVDAINSGAADDGDVAVSDGAGNVSWSNLASSFTGLSDTPSSYTSQALKLLRVKSTEDGIEFATLPARDLSTINEVSDYTTTSTSFTDVDATDLSVTFTTSGGDVIMFFVCSVKQSSTNRLYFNIDVDGSPHAIEDGIIMWRSPHANVITPIGIVQLITGLSAASHTFKIQWKVDAGTATMYAGAATSNADVHPHIIGLEMPS